MSYGERKRNHPLQTTQFWLLKELEMEGNSQIKEVTDKANPKQSCKLGHAIPTNFICIMLMKLGPPLTIIFIIY